MQPLLAAVEVGILLAQMSCDLSGFEGESIAIDLTVGRRAFEGRHQAHVDARGLIDADTPRRKGILPTDVNRGRVGRRKNLPRRMRPVDPHRHIVGVALERRSVTLSRGGCGFEGRRFAHSGIPFPGER